MKKRYECLTCGGVSEFDGEITEESIKCCEKPNLKVLRVDLEGEDPKVLLGENYERIIKVLKYYLDLPKDYYKLVAIWIIGTYFHQEFSSYPFLFFNAMRGSGKTRTLKLISSLGAKGDGSVQNDITESVLFRIPKGTVTCIDECERIGSKEKSTLRELLNAAYKKGVKVKRMKKVRKDKEDSYEVEEFEPYIPIAMANIRGIDEVLEDRSLTLILDKSNNPLKTKKIEDFDESEDISSIKRTFNQISVVSVVSLRHKRYIQAWNDYISSKYNNTNNTNNIYTHTTQTTPQEIIREELFNKIDDAGIDGRNFELLFPLLIIANELGDEVFVDVLKIGLELITQKKKEESSDSVDVSLIEYVSTIDEESRFSYLPLKSVLSGFRTYIGESSQEDSWLNPKWLGNALKRLNLISDRKRKAGGRTVLLNIDKAKSQMRMFKSEEEKK